MQPDLNAHTDRQTTETKIKSKRHTHKAQVKFAAEQT